MLKIKFNSIWNGVAPSQYFQKEGQFLNSIGIDPDLPISDAVGDRRTSGALRPSGYASFDSTQNDGNPYWIMTSPKTALIYTYLSSGKFNSYTSAFGSETNIGTPTSGAGNGAAYYNNYIYLATPTQVFRYGPLNGTAALSNALIANSELLDGWDGGTDTVMVNTTYPAIRGSGTFPNHPMHAHVDNKLYIGDFKNGIGYLHFIKTSKTTDEGDTNDGSTYGALDLPFGFMPMDIESYGTDLVIAAIQTTNSTLNQGRAALFFWDTVSTSFYHMIWLPDPLVTALYNHNGLIHIFSGGISTGTDVSNGYRLSVYLGGDSLKQLYYSNTGSPPLAGAVDAVGTRLAWGTFQQVNTTTASAPTYYATVMAYGSKDSNFPAGVHSIAKASAVGSAADGLVTAIKNVQQSSFAYPKLVIGSRDASNHWLDSQSTTYGTNVWHSPMINIGKKFAIKRIRIPLAAAVAANMTITPKVFLDDFSSSSTTDLTVINSTNYANSNRHIQYYPSIHGNHNFCLELTWSGTALLPILFPIEIDVQEESD